MSNVPIMLWAVDDDAPGGVSPLPPSPFLLPGAIICGLLWLLTNLPLGRSRYRLIPPPPGVDPDLYWQCSRDYRALEWRDDLDHEQRAYRRSLRRPVWAGGEVWAYED